MRELFVVDAIIIDTKILNKTKNEIKTTRKV